MRTALIAVVLITLAVPASAIDQKIERRDIALSALALTFTAVSKCKYYLQPEGFSFLSIYGDFAVKDVSRNNELKAKFAEYFKGFEEYGDRSQSEFCEFAYDRLGPNGGVFKTLRKTPLD